MTIEIEEGSGNVFQDLEMPDAVLKLAKVKLAVLINTIIDFKSQSILDLTSKQYKNLRAGRLEDFTLDDLLKIYKNLTKSFDDLCHAYLEAIDNKALAVLLQKKFFDEIFMRYLKDLSE